MSLWLPGSNHLMVHGTRCDEVPGVMRGRHISRRIPSEKHTSRRLRGDSTLPGEVKVTEHFQTSRRPRSAWRRCHLSVLMTVIQSCW